MTSSDDDRQLLSLIAHELRSPAGVVGGYLRLVLKEDAASMPERARHMIEEADRSCARVLHLVRELADLVHLLETDRRGSSSAALVFSLCDEVVQAAAGAHDGLVFSCASEDRPALVQCDESRLKRALAALLAATLREHGAKPLEVFGVVSRDYGAAEAVVAFGDPGIALRRDEVLVGREAPFDRWRGGTGLSVPIACRILEASGGRIWLPSQASRAVCALSLPIDIR